MSKSKLTIVPGAENGVYDLGSKRETTAERVQRLQREAHLLAREQVEAFERQLADLVASATEIAGGGEAYPAGVRDLARTLAEDLTHKGQTMTALVERNWR